jgi:hypothetical protein
MLPHFAQFRNIPLPVVAPRFGVWKPKSRFPGWHLYQDSKTVHNCTDADSEYHYSLAATQWNVWRHVPCGVTAHGGPGGPLQFDRLEAALAATFQE